MKRVWVGLRPILTIAGVTLAGVFFLGMIGTFAADAAGVPPFDLAIGGLDFYRFRRSAQGFNGTVLGPTYWFLLTLVLALTLGFRSGKSKKGP